MQRLSAHSANCAAQLRVPVSVAQLGIDGTKDALP